MLDVERERLDELERLLRAKWGEETLQKFLEAVPINPEWRLMTKLRLLKDACFEALESM